MRIAVLGLGEAGGEIARDLVATGRAQVVGYDPAVPAPPDVTAAADEASAVRDCEIVLSLVTAECARGALCAARPGLAPGVVWADANTSGPALKTELDALASAAGAQFADVAVMSPVPGRGLRAPLVASGVGAVRAADLLRPLGAEVEVLAAPAGAAATRKLLRSIFFKGTAAAVVEALRTAAAYDLDDWLRDHIASELTAADAIFAARLETGSYTHARRRADEMSAAAELVGTAGQVPRVSAAAADLLREIAGTSAPLPRSLSGERCAPEREGP